jgi:hypothetical protein
MKFCSLSTDKPLKELERDDVLAYLDSLRKSESSDSLHKWIGTYNLHRVHLLRFFKWLHSPDIEQRKRPKPPLFMNFAKKYKIDPMVCYEVAHELELSLIEICMTKGFDEAEIEVHKHIAEMDWKTRKEEMMRYKV